MGRYLIKVANFNKRREFDIAYYAQKEIANDGVGKNGKWTGFDKVKKVLRVEFKSGT